MDLTTTLENDNDWFTFNHYTEMKLVIMFIAVIHIVIAISFGMCILIKAYMPAHFNVFMQAYIIIMACFVIAIGMVKLINYTADKWL